MCLFGKTKRTKKYVNALELIEKKNISNVRKRIKILVVDDESDDIYNILKEREYDAYYKNDMNYTIEAEPFDIIIMDIKGVAMRRGSNMQGFALACDVKKKYPMKKVCCYSGSTYKEISEQLSENRIDAFIIKDMDIDKMCERIDNLILDYVNYEKQWEVIRSQLKEYNVGDNDIHQIKEAYYAGFTKGEISLLGNTVIDTLKNGTVMINIASAIISLIKAVVL